MLAAAGFDWPSVPAHVHLYVPDLNATYRLALEAGDVSVSKSIQKGLRQQARRRPQSRRNDLVDRY